MLPVFTAEEMRRVDQRAIRELGIPGATLMENAGRGAAEQILAELSTLGFSRRGVRVAILCGKGGNGGDGFVVARWLKRAGHRVEVFLLARPDELRGDAALKHREMERRAIRTRVVQDDTDLARALADADLVVDALLGTGARGAPAPAIARAIEQINTSGRPVVSLDIPSGLPADGEAPAGPVVRALLTTTFAGIKRGLIGAHGRDTAGRVEVVDIGVPPAEVARGVATFLLQAADVACHFPRRPREAHKGRMASVVWHFFNQYRASGKVQLFEGSGGYAAGEQSRDFVSVEDVVKVNLEFLDHPDRSGIYNLGTGTAATFNAVATTTINACRAADNAPALSYEELHRAGAIEYIAFPPGLAGKYQSHTQADLARLRAAGYDAPLLDAKEGVARCVGALLASPAVNA